MGSREDFSKCNVLMDMTETLESAWRRMHVDTSVAKLPAFSEKEAKSDCKSALLWILEMLQLVTTIFSNPFLCYSSQGVCFLGLSQLVFMFLTDSLLLFPIHCFQSHFYFLAIFCFCWVIISVVSSGTSALLSNFFCRVLKVFCSERTVRCKRFFGPWQTHHW